MPDSPLQPPQGRITFMGRGIGYVHGSRIVLKVCPECSQRNAPHAAERGLCGWCAYVPSLDDVEPAVCCCRDR